MLCADCVSNRLILPHMGWNDVEPVEGSALFEGLETASRFYFLHSFGFHCNDGNTLATSEYGTRFVSAVHKDNVFGVQFHPEKSHHYGSRLLQRSEEHTSELQSLMRISYAVFCLKKQNNTQHKYS